MTSNKKQILAGISILIIGIIMFFIAIDTFTYLGDINPIYSKLGEVCFISCLPVTIIGLVVTIVFLFQKNKS